MSIPNYFFISVQNNNNKVTLILEGPIKKKDRLIATFILSYPYIYFRPAKAIHHLFLYITQLQ